MSSQLPVPRQGTEVSTEPIEPIAYAGTESHDAQRPHQEQNLAVALLPLALVAVLILSLIAAAWTFLAIPR